MIYDKVHELVRDIKASPEFRELKAAREKLEKNSESQKVLQDFHVKRFEIQSMQMQGKEIPVEKKQEYEKMVELIRLHPTVSEYLEAEYKMAKIMEDIQKIIIDGLEFKPFEKE
ncbi:MAG: YlbF family regulator [Clostridia bacterium]|jgi:cell fate (sporulation/competence/biofilm development) regulator YlbF (YheA/YmcA/DUF963 family)|nr:YlbF family regulator [Clostridia bacterium]